MRIKVFEKPDWRRPAIAAAEETYDPTSGHHMNDKGRGRSVVWIFHDRYQLDDLKRLADGTLCSECLEPMPAKPSVQNLYLFREVYEGKPEPVGSAWRGNVARGCCPICGTEVSTEYFEALHRGTLPPIPDIEQGA